jgi:tetratricopeptide (TPR) repeat protein
MPGMSNATPVDERAEQRYREALAAFRRGDNAACRQISSSGLAEAAEAGDERGQALSHLNLSRADFRDGAYATGIEHAVAADSHAAACGADDLRITALHMRAELTRAAGDYAKAVPMYEQLLAADQARGDEAALAMEHYNLGSVLLQARDLDAARSHLQRSLELCPAKPEQLGYTLLGYAGWLVRAGDPRIAGQVLGAVEQHLESLGEVLDPAEAVELASHVAVGRERDAAAFDAGRRAGRSLTLAEAQALIA